MLVTKEEFIDWKKSPVTQEVFGTIRDKVNQLVEYVIEDSGNNPVKAAEYCGAIKAFRDLLDIQYEETL